MFSNVVVAMIVALSVVGVAPSGVAKARPVAPRVIGDLSLSPMSQQNAVQKAQDYLDYAPFSRRGLIQQLVFDGFSSEDALFAVDSLTVDWNEQAAKKARDYLDYTSFSQQGLLQQLQFDGFTPSQAAYGVSVVYQ